MALYTVTVCRDAVKGAARGNDRVLMDLGGAKL